MQCDRVGREQEILRSRSRGQKLVILCYVRTALNQDIHNRYKLTSVCTKNRSKKKERVFVVSSSFSEVR